jgi:predicted glycosyltransferase
LKINKISTSKKIILHPSQNFPDLDEFDVIEKLSKKISESEHFILAVKFHPSQDVVGLTSKIQTLNNTIILKNSMSVLDCLSIADFTLLVSSTFAIDSLIAGIPVVVYTPHSKIKGVAKELVKQAGCLEFTNDTLHRLPILLKDNNYKEKLNLESQLKFKKDYCEFYNVESGHLISDILQNEID